MNICNTVKNLLAYEVDAPALETLHLEESLCLLLQDYVSICQKVVLVCQFDLGSIRKVACDEHHHPSALRVVPGLFLHVK